MTELEELKSIVRRLINCDDGGDIKYMIYDGKELFKKYGWEY